MKLTAAALTLLPLPLLFLGDYGPRRHVVLDPAVQTVDLDPAGEVLAHEHLLDLPRHDLPQVADRDELLAGETDRLSHVDRALTPALYRWRHGRFPDLRPAGFRAELPSRRASARRATPRRDTLATAARSRRRCDRRRRDRPPRRYRRARRVSSSTAACSCCAS